MTSLPRGICPVCEEIVALRKGNLVREHRSWPREGVERKGWVGKSHQPLCDGSGRPAAGRIRIVAS